jgi:phospho-N-acetylmuramoyl-pentapeptide-transferase
MLLLLLYPFHDTISALNVFKYITFRTFGAVITGVLICLMLGPKYIAWLKSRQIGQSVRDDGPQSHFSKKGTPTMGGGLILSSVALSTLLWADLTSPTIWISLLTTLACGVIGFVDDYKKVIKKNSKGISARQKLVGQLLVATAAASALYFLKLVPPTLTFPFFKTAQIDLGLFFIPFAVLVIVGASNAVNLTDGLDGLAVGPTITTAVTFSILAYCSGNLMIADYLQIPHVPGASELSIFLGGIAAACLGFLWYNTYPAMVFMGDVGALALGAALGVAAVTSKNEFLLVLCGGVFVVEALSVMAQVFSFKLTGKRVLKMAPIHHHFELLGWPEPRVIVRFWIISILLAVMTLATLKLR